MEQRKILQTGLYSKSDQETKEMVERVDKFNMNHIGSAIKLDVIPYKEGDQFVDGPHYKFRFLFPNRQIQRAFWTE